MSVFKAKESQFKVTEGRNNKQTFKTLDRSIELTTFGLRKAWFAVGQDLKKTANKAVLRKPRQGRVYIIRGPSGKRRRHIASRPGESHANRSGELRKSLSWKVTGRDLNFGYGIIKNDAPEYANDVEEGTKHMKSRPTLKNSIKANQRNAEQHLLAAVKKEFK